jgi:hypothetical protein
MPNQENIEQTKTRVSEQDGVSDERKEVDVICILRPNKKRISILRGRILIIKSDPVLPISANMFAALENHELFATASFIYIKMLYRFSSFSHMTTIGQQGRKLQRSPSLSCICCLLLCM